MVCDAGMLMMAKRLVEGGAKVDFVTRAAQTALMDACRAGRAEVIDFLLDAGAAINLETATGRTPLMVSATYGQVSRDWLTSDGSAP
jgi:ankyrin repeat protein